MDMDKIQEHLEQSVLATTPGTRESIQAHEALTDFIKTRDSQQNREFESAVRREEANRQAESERKRNRHENLMDWIKVGIDAAGLITSTLLIGKAIKDDKDGAPWYGAARDFLSNLIRKRN